MKNFRLLHWWECLCKLGTWWRWHELFGKRELESSSSISKTNKEFFKTKHGNIQKVRSHKKEYAIYGIIGISSSFIEYYRVSNIVFLLSRQKYNISATICHLFNGQRLPWQPPSSAQLPTYLSFSVPYSWAWSSFLCLHPSSQTGQILAFS